jgi:hypothetical protein
MSQATPTLSSQDSAPAATPTGTVAAALVSKSLLGSAKERLKDLMASIPSDGTLEESDIELWGKQFVGLLVCLQFLFLHHKA